jgi:hypothetical protein
MVQQIEIERKGAIVTKQLGMEKVRPVVAQ